MIRENIDTLILEVLPLGKTWREVRYTLGLKNAMIRHHRPAWNARLAPARKLRK